MKIASDFIYTVKKLEQKLQTIDELWAMVDIVNDERYNDI